VVSFNGSPQAIDEGLINSLQRHCGEEHEATAPDDKQNISARRSGAMHHTQDDAAMHGQGGSVSGSKLKNR
jgi:hypothetical protein